MLSFFRDACVSTEDGVSEGRGVAWLAFPEEEGNEASNAFPLSSLCSLLFLSVLLWEAG